MTKITAILAREVLDSRGNPTVEAEVWCEQVVGRAIAPSGASTGAHEALELRDGDTKRFRGKGVLGAIANVRGLIASALVGSPLDQSSVDQRLIELDGTGRFEKLGANATIAVSMAVAHAIAAARGVPLYQSLRQADASLPLPMVNMISGGLHAGRQVEFQDFLILPVGADSYSQALEWIVSVYRSLAAELTRHGREAVLVGDEGGFGPKLSNNREAIEHVLAAIEAAGFQPGEQVAIGLDVASTHFYRDGRYWLRLDQGEPYDLDADAMIELLGEWVDSYPIISIEDGLAEDDWQGWHKLHLALGERVQLIGDDLFTTHSDRLRRGIDERSANAVLVKPNQIGTLTQTLTVIAQARQAGIATVVSARSGETEDTTIADLAVATGSGQIKIGSIVRGERLCKYNRLLRIEEETAGMLSFAGSRSLKRQRSA